VDAVSAFNSVAKAAKEAADQAEIAKFEEQLARVRGVRS
jgi:hypothetical protein